MSSSRSLTLERTHSRQAPRSTTCLAERLSQEISTTTASPILPLLMDRMFDVYLNAGNGTFQAPRMYAAGAGPVSASVTGISTTMASAISSSPTMRAVRWLCCWEMATAHSKRLDTRPCSSLRPVLPWGTSTVTESSTSRWPVRSQSRCCSVRGMEPSLPWSAMPQPAGS